MPRQFEVRRRVAKEERRPLRPIDDDAGAGRELHRLAFVGHADNVFGVGKNDGARIGFPAAPAYVPSGVVIVDEFEGVDCI